MPENCRYEAKDYRSPNPPPWTPVQEGSSTPDMVVTNVEGCSFTVKVESI